MHAELRVSGNFSTIRRMTNSASNFITLANTVSVLMKRRVLFFFYMSALALMCPQLSLADGTTSNFNILQIAQTAQTDLWYIQHDYTVGSCPCTYCGWFVLKDTVDNSTFYSGKLFKQRSSLLMGAFLSGRQVAVGYTTGVCTGDGYPLITTVYVPN